MSTTNATTLISCPKCGTPVERPEGYNPKAKTNKEKENNPKVYCHFCWFNDEYIKQDPAGLGTTKKGGGNK